MRTAWVNDERIDDETAVGSHELGLGLDLSILAVIGFTLALLGARDPKKPNALGEFWIPKGVVPLIVGGAFFGLCFLFRFFASISLQTLSLKQITFSILICVAAGVVSPMLKIRKKPAACASQEPRADIIELAGKTVQPPNSRPRSTPRDKLAA